MHAEAPRGLALIESLDEARLKQGPKHLGQAVTLESLHEKVQLDPLLHASRQGIDKRRNVPVLKTRFPSVSSPKIHRQVMCQGGQPGSHGAAYEIPAQLGFGKQTKVQVVYDRLAIGATQNPPHGHVHGFVRLTVKQTDEITLSRIKSSLRRRVV
jgi:hypothetical protein